MPRPLRHVDPSTPYFITARCLEERFFLAPGNETTRIVGGWLARAVQRFGIELYVFLAMSNHWHLVLRAPRGNLAAFMQYLQGNIARDLNRALDRSGAFWHRRYSAEPILDDAALETRIAYALNNPVKAYLVDDVRQWPGLSSAPALLEGREMVFRIVARAALALAGYPEDESRFESEVELVHTPPPSWVHLDDAARAARLRELLDGGAAVHRAERKRQGVIVKTREELFAVDPFHRPTSPKRTFRPLCHASTQAARERHRDEVHALAHVYALASERYRRGRLDTAFPAGMFRPWLIEPVCLARAA